jgi:hypothetical protein
VAVWIRPFHLDVALGKVACGVALLPPPHGMDGREAVGLLLETRYEFPALDRAPAWAAAVRLPDEDERWAEHERAIEAIERARERADAAEGGG